MKRREIAMAIAGLEARSRVERLLRVWRPGERCRAVLRIVYAFANVEIDEGETGRVESITPARVLKIVWDGRTDALATSPDGVDPAEGP